MNDTDFKSKSLEELQQYINVMRILQRGYATVGILVLLLMFMFPGVFIIALGGFVVIYAARLSSNLDVIRAAVNDAISSKSDK